MNGIVIKKRRIEQKNKYEKIKDMGSKGVFDVIKAALWEQDIEGSFQDVYEVFRNHSILALPTDILPKLFLPIETYDTWKNNILQQISYYANYKYIQSKMPITVPYVILKGTSASQYYPRPEYRAMGDIDIMTSREDFDRAYQELISDGYKVMISSDREIEMKKNGIVLELHKSFASLNDIYAAKYLDDLIISNINSTHVLADPINGLVLLEHINQHLENGLGLRQIIDWMLFVNQHLPDEKWPEFQSMANRIGLDKLAIVVTRMCEIYLGLPRRKWCENADESLCNQLMEYILECGNFGVNRVDDNSIAEIVLIRARSPISAFKLLQERGLVNWEAPKKYKILRPFAWIYQIGRYLHKGLHRKNAVSEIKKEYRIAKERMLLFDALGVKQISKGIAVYRQGKYDISYKRP